MTKQANSNSQGIRLVKTNFSSYKCPKCKGNDFSKFSISWACMDCGHYIYPELVSKIVKEKGIKL